MWRTMVARPPIPTVTAPAKGACLMVANYAPDVGYAWWLMEHYWVLLAKNMAEQGRRALLAYPSHGEIPPAIQAAPIDVLWLDFGDRSDAGWRALSETVRREGVTSLYLTDRAYADRRYARLRRLGVERIAIHDHTPGDRPAIRGPKGWIKSGLRRFGPWSADLYVAVSEFVRQRMVENARVPVESTVVVPNGVVPFEYSDVDRAWARGQLDAKDDDVVVGMVGRAHRIKGIEFAIRRLVSSWRGSRGLYLFSSATGRTWIDSGRWPRRRASLRDSSSWGAAGTPVA